MEAILTIGTEGQRILDLCRAVREIQDYDNPHLALTWIRLIEETEEPLKLTSREFISAVKEMHPVVQGAYFSAIRKTGDVKRLTNSKFMSDLKKLDNDNAINRLKSIVRRY